MNLAVVGSRTFTNYTLLKQTIDSFDFKIDKIVSGGAKGADSLAEKYCLENKIEKLIFYADWKRFKKRAGMIRNEDIIRNSDVVVAFWDGISSGTKNSISLAKKYNKELFVIQEPKNIDELIKEF